MKLLRHPRQLRLYDFGPLLMIVSGSLSLVIAWIYLKATIDCGFNQILSERSGISCTLLFGLLAVVFFGALALDLHQTRNENRSL
jgi:hypothetical protein